MKKDYGYRINISQKPYSELYERYKKYKNIPMWCPLSDGERLEFEKFVLNRKERKNMSDELIRKSDVIDLLNSLDLNLLDYDIYSQLFDTVDNMQPVNAVELPCKIGDKIYEPCKFCNAVHEYEVVGFRYKYEMVFIECDERELTDKDIGVRAFFTREEAEKALEDLKNE